MYSNSVFEKYPNYRFLKENLKRKPYINSVYNIINNCKKVQVQQIVGQNSCCPVIEFNIPFPEKFPALELEESITSIRDITTNILKDIVLINGLIHKRISYIFFEESYDFKYTNSHLECNVGNIKVLCLDIPFSCFLKIPGIQTCDIVNIDYAGTEASNVIDILDSPMTMEQSPINQYKNLKEKLIVKIDITVLRIVETSVLEW